MTECCEARPVHDRQRRVLRAVLAINVAMVLVEIVPRASAIPLAELTVSACFAVLVFSSVASESDNVFTYYYGTLSGLLLYVIVRGLPAAA